VVIHDRAHRRDHHHRWLADTSVLHHINPVPAADLDWKSATWLVGLASATATVGASASNCAT
jgi:hypothetical protein